MKYFLTGIVIALCSIYSFLVSPNNTGTIVTISLIIVSVCELTLQKNRPHHFHKSFATILTNYLLVPLCCLNISTHMIKYFLTFYAALSIFTMIAKSNKSKTHFTLMALCGVTILLAMSAAFVIESEFLFKILIDLVAAILITMIIVYGINPYLDSAADYMSGFIVYIKPMKRPMIAFFGGYLYVVIIFTFINVCLYLIAPDQYSITLTNQSRTSDIIAILLYSVSTYGIYNYNLVAPNALLSQIIYIAESLIGCAWLAIILAAVIGYLQKEFEEINEKK